MFTVKDRSLFKRGALLRVGSWTYLERLARDKCISLFGPFVSAEGETFYYIGYWLL